MELVDLSVVFVVIAFISLIWRYRVNSFLKTESGAKDGNQQSDPSFQINQEEYVEYKKAALGTAEVTFFDLDRDSLGLTKIDPKAVPNKKPIERELKIQYKRSIYVDKSFPLKIEIAAEKRKIQISKNGKKIQTIEKINFEAFEEEPKVSVELKFAESDFKINQVKKTRKLSKSKSTFYDFTVTPLKAEDCVLTVVFSFKDKIPLFKVQEKNTIDKTITESGKTRKEHSEEIKKVAIESKEIEVKTVDLVIKVKKLLGLNAKQLDLLKKAAPAMVAVPLFIYKIISGELQGWDAILGAVPALLSACGVEIGDKLFGNPAEDESDD